MATSGTVTYRTNRDQIIQGALRLCMAIDPENTSAITTNQTSNAAEALNLMVKGWEAEGLQLWERKYAAIFPQYGQEWYVLGGPGPAGDHACLSTPLGSGFIDTTLSAAAANGASTVTVTSTAIAAVYATVGNPSISMTSGYNIGVQLDSGSMFWTTINGAPVGSVVTLTASLTGAASSGNRVVCYQTKLTRPLRIVDGFTRKSQGNDVPHLLIPRELYNRFGLKSASGTTIQTYYDPQENVGHLYVYPASSSVTDTFFIEFQKAIEDFTSSTDDFDLPQEWGEALKYNLAWRVAPEYGVPMERYNMIKELAIMTFSKLDAWDQEDRSIYLQPSQWAYMSDSGGSN